MSDNVLNTPGLMDPSTEFGNIMQHAMKIKGHQMDQDRKKFETWPQFLQNSMWERNEEALRLRQLPAPERLEGAQALKEQGNEHFKAQRYADAIEHYEAAVGSFRYAKQLDPDWKKKGIKDETIDLIDERGDEGSAERRDIDTFCVSVYNNLAASYVARAAAGRPEPGGSIEGDYRLCVHACTFGIELEPTPKALYRRARGLCEPMTATDADVDKAMRDLADAAQRAPDDKAVRQLLAKLKRGRAEAKAKEKGALSGLFNKTGEGLYDANSLEEMAKRDAAEKKANDPDRGRVRTAEDAEKEAKEAEAAVEHLRRQGRHEDAKSLEEKIAAHREQLGQYKEQVAEQEAEQRRHDPRYIDYANPTDEQVRAAARRLPHPEDLTALLHAGAARPRSTAHGTSRSHAACLPRAHAQVADAKKHGIDLRDPLVVRELQKLQQEKEFGGEDDDDDDYDGSGGGRGGGGSREEVPSHYRGKQMNSRLQRMREMGEDGDELGRGGAHGDGGDDALPPDGLKPRTKTIIMAVAFAIGLYRIWAMLGHASGFAPGGAHGAMDDAEI